MITLTPGIFGQLPVLVLMSSIEKVMIGRTRSHVHDDTFKYLRLQEEEVTHPIA